MKYPALFVFGEGGRHEMLVLFVSPTHARVLVSGWDSYPVGTTYEDSCSYICYRHHPDGIYKELYYDALGISHKVLTKEEQNETTKEAVTNT